jgi:hypothetical protein
MSIRIKKIINIFIILKKDDFNKLLTDLQKIENMFMELYYAAEPHFAL